MGRRSRGHGGCAPAARRTDRAVGRVERRAAPQDQGRGGLHGHRVPARLRRRGGRGRAARAPCRRALAGWDRAAGADRDPHGRGARARRRLLRPRAEPGGQAEGTRLRGGDAAVTGHHGDRSRSPTAGHRADRPRQSAPARPVAPRAGLRVAHDGGRSGLAGGARDPQDGDGPVRVRGRLDVGGARSRRRGAEPRQRSLPRWHARRVRTSRRHGRGIPGRCARGRVRRAGAPRRRCPASGACGGGAPGDAPAARRGAGRGVRRPPQRAHRGRDRRGDRGTARSGPSACQWARGECGEAPGGGRRRRRDPDRRGHAPAGARFRRGRGGRAGEAAARAARERRAPAQTEFAAGGTRPADRGLVERGGGRGGRPHVPPGDRARARGRREVAARGGLRRRARRARVRRARPLPALRREHHLLAACRDRARSDRCGRGQGGELARSDRGAARRRPEGGADRLGRGGHGGSRRLRRDDQRGDLLGGAPPVRGAGPRPAARDRDRRPPVGGADLPGPRGARGRPRAGRAGGPRCAWRAPSCSRPGPAGAAGS